MTRTLDPADCPEPYWHRTHHYCPCCSYVSDDAIARMQEKERTADWYAERLRAAGGDVKAWCVDDGWRIFAAGLRRTVPSMDGPPAPTLTAALRAAWEAAGEP